MSFDPQKVEWHGVEEVYSRKENALYRANTTSVVMGSFFTIMFFVLGINSTLHLSPMMLGLGLLAILVIIWCLSFIVGYYMKGNAVSQGYSFFEVTPNTNMGLRIGDILPVSLEGLFSHTYFSSKIRKLPPSSLFTKDGLLSPDIFSKQYKASQAYLANEGILTISKYGIEGMVKLPWKDIFSIKSISPQDVQMLKIDKFFYIPIGRRTLTLRFHTPEDTSSFLSLIDQYKQANQNPA